MFAKRAPRGQGRRKTSLSEDETSPSPATSSHAEVDAPAKAGRAQRKLMVADSDSDRECFQVKKSKASRRMTKGLLQKQQKLISEIILPDTDPSEGTDLEADIEEARRREEVQVAREKREHRRQGIDAEGSTRKRKHFMVQPEARPAKTAEAFDIMGPREVEETPVVLAKLNATQALNDLERLILQTKTREENAKTRTVTARQELEGSKVAIEQTNDQIEKVRIKHELLLDCEELVKNLAGLMDAKAGKVNDAVATLRAMEKEASLRRWTEVDELGRSIKWPCDVFEEDRFTFLKAVHKQLLKDIGEDFAGLNSLLKPFGNMKRQYRGLYTSAYIPLSIKEVVQTHVRLELLWWDPLHFVGDLGDERPGGRCLIQDRTLDEFDWFKALCDYSLDDNDPDSDLVPAVVIQEVFPILAHYVQIWDMRDVNETHLLRAVIEESMTFLETDDKPLRELENALKARLDCEWNPQDAAVCGKNLALFHDVFADEFLGPLLFDLWKEHISKTAGERKWSLLLDMIPANPLRSYFQPVVATLGACPAAAANQIRTKLQAR